MKQASMRIRSVNVGFSVTELLVVLVIILVLVGILLPVLSSARRSAQVVACASNLRQIGQALLAYRADFDRFPITAVMPAPFDNPQAPPFPIYDALAAYVSADSQIYRCPSDPMVYDRCAAVSPKGRGINYIYVEVAPKGHAVMWDYGGDSLHGLITPWHSGGGANGLHRDGSVHFESD